MRCAASRSLVPMDSNELELGFSQLSKAFSNHFHVEMHIWQARSLEGAVLVGGCNETEQWKFFEKRDLKMKHSKLFLFIFIDG